MLKIIPPQSITRIHSRLPLFLLAASAAAVVFLSAQPSAQAQLIGYQDRSDVNLVNAWNATLTYTGSFQSPASLTDDETRFNIENGAGQQNRFMFTSSSPSLAANFGETRNIKTLRTYGGFGNFGFTAATVETSTDNVNWTTRAATVTNPDVSNVTVTLTTSVDAQYVRVTPTTFDDGNGIGSRWILATVRAFGDTGTLAGNENLSILANSAYTANQTLSTVGTVSTIAPTQMVDPATSPTERQLVFAIGNTEGFKLDLGQNFTVNRGALNVAGIGTASSAAPVTLTLSASTDDINFTSIYTKTYTSNISAFDLFNFSFTPTEARYLSFVFTDSGANTDIRVSDMAIYQTIPEPSTIALLGMGALGLMLRRRRTA